MGGSFSVNTLDLFAEPVHFSFKKQTYFKTTCGGLVSIIQGIVLILYFYYLINELISREIPIIVDSQTVYSNPKNISFHKDENFSNIDSSFVYNKELNVFYNALGIKKNTNTPYYLSLTPDTRKYFDLIISNIIMSEDGSKKIIPITPEKCTKFANYEKEFNSLKLQNMYCINQNFELEGYQNMPNSKLLEIKFSRCINATAIQYGITCFPDNVINDFVKDIQIEWYYDNSILNTTSVNNVKSNNLEQKYWDILSKYTKSCKIPFGMDSIRLYNSYIPDFLYSGYTEENTLSIREFATEITDLNSKGVLLEIDFIADELKITYERRYLDIFSQLATLGGMCDVIFLIGFIFVWHISNEKFNEELVNTFYNISDPNNKKSEENKNLIELYQTHNLTLDKKKLENSKTIEFDEYIRILYNLHRHITIKNFHKIYVKEDGKRANGRSKNKKEIKTDVAEKEKKNQYKEEGVTLFDQGEDLNGPNLYYENFFNISKIESMFNLPKNHFLNCCSEYIKYMDTQNDNDNLNEIENQGGKLQEIQINENSYLKNERDPGLNKSQAKKIANNNAENIELQELKKKISDKESNNFVYEKNDKNLINIKSEKNRLKEEFENRKNIATFFYEKNNVDYFQFLLKHEKNENYLKFKILYDALKFNNNRMELSKIDFAKYLFDCSSYNIESDHDKEKFSNKKKLLLFHVAKQKLKIDFDIVNILKTIDQFNDFKEIIMNNNELKLFDFAIKKISNKNFFKNRKRMNKQDHSAALPGIDIFFKNGEREEYEEKMDIIKQTEEGLNEIFQECMENGPTPKHINLFKCIGINSNLVKEFEELKNLKYGIFHFLLLRF